MQRVLDEYERTVAPVWPRLRAQVVHTDLTVDNTLTDDAGLITGVIDFGDMSHTALITDLASVLDSLGTGRGATTCSGSPGSFSTAISDGSSWRSWSCGAGGDVGGAERADDRHQLVAGRPGARGAGVCRALQRRVRADDRDDAQRRLAGDRSQLGRARTGAGRRDAGQAAGGGVRAHDGAAVLRRPATGGGRRWRVDHRRERPSLPRRVQQRAVRRPCATRA